MSWYWFDTGWGCGALVVADGIVIDSAPIFWRFRGKPLPTYYHYKLVPLE